jgi:hypothetical protein
VGFVRRVLFVAVAGVALGLGSARLALDQGVAFGRLASGPWVGLPLAGGAQADPYTRARLVRTGEIPVGGGEGVTFIATTDQGGRALVATCDYRVEGGAPPARWWTLTIVLPDGRVPPFPNGRHGLTSVEVTRDATGSASVALSRDARPGDRLTLDFEGTFHLALRLYDTPATTPGTLVALDLPRIAREGCRG